jgi:tRNA threonylcarbamoyladenosine biosynthesis protein TsaB
MLVLALDTTTRAGSAALLDDERIVEERRGDPSRTHAERLPGELLALLSAHDLTAASIDLFAVASGPGSFTGLRVGIATMQGLAFVGGRPIVGVSALEALGHSGSLDHQPGARVVVWMDAHRRDVFAALYRVTPAALFDPGRLACLDGPLVGEPLSMLDRWAGELGEAPVSWIGDGATAFAGIIANHVPSATILPHPPLAGAIGRIAIARARGGGAVRPAAIQPLYVRRPDAEIDREKRGRADGGETEREGRYSG